MKFANKYNRFAFTLAEVLITLGIIGIVAAITIPTLINNSQKAQYVTSLKKFYSTMNQALQQMANDSGCAGNLVCTGAFDGTDLTGYADVHDKAVRSIAAYLKTTSIGTSPVANYSALQGPGSWGGTMFTTAVLTNGSFFSAVANGNNCANVIVASAIPACTLIYVDVNGAKGPNQEGRDFFEFYVLPNATLWPSGGLGTNKDGARSWYGGTGNYHCRPDTGNTIGRSCSGRIIEENWEMNY